jgi:hypothetical protein
MLIQINLSSISKKNIAGRGRRRSVTELEGIWTGKKACYQNDILDYVKNKDLQQLLRHKKPERPVNPAPAVAQKMHQYL